MPTRDIFNSNTQQVEPAELSVDLNNEIVATFEDGSFVKFATTHPDGTPITAEEFDQLIELEHVHNAGKEIITPEREAAKAAERQNAFELIGATEQPPAEQDLTHIPVTEVSSNGPDVEETPPTE